MKLITTRAENDFARVWSKIKSAETDALKDYLLRVTPALVTRYGDASALAAQSFYSELRDLHIKSEFNVLAADAVSSDQVQATVKYAIGSAYKGDVDNTKSLLLGALQRYVNQPARDTIWQNGIRDPAKPRWARIPQGDTCAFCLMLAGRGFVYLSEGDAMLDSQGNSYHDFCDCVAVVDFSDSPGLEGYDSTKYEDIYRASVAFDQYNVTDIHDTLKNMRLNYPDSVTDGYVLHQQL